jgi:rubrerythrin
MTDLISRDKAVAAVLGTSIEYQLIYGKKEPKEGFVRSLIKSIANIPQEETERKHGKWIFQRNYTWACSECGMNPTKGMGYVQSKDELFDFCPNCGARMDKDD